MLHQFLRKAVNYHPVSLICKLFEHILAHLEDHNIVTDFNMASGQEDHVKLN